MSTFDPTTDPRVERPADPNAPKTLNLARCQQLIRAAPQHGRFPLGDVIQEMAGQLKCAVDELGTISTKITDANNQTLRYQKESETANAEVRTMQTLLGTARDEARVAREELAILKAKIDEAEKQKAEPAVAAPPVERVRRPRKGKVVPMGEVPKSAAQ